jgi:PIN domain nuclease of toxin-antitoxin system
MKLLLDTAVFLWWVTASESVTAAVRTVVSAPANEVWVSAVSSWEIALKHGSGRLPLPEAPETLVPHERRRHGFGSLPLDERSTLHLPRLPRLHKDPFDRMLVCQAIEHGLTLVTPDRAIRQYPIRTLW